MTFTIANLGDFPMLAWIRSSIPSTAGNQKQGSTQCLGANLITFVTWSLLIGRSYGGKLSSATIINARTVVARIYFKGIISAMGRISTIFH